MEKCNIKHKHGGQQCNRAEGHTGACRSMARRHGSCLIYSEWMSQAGKFSYHIGYKSIYPQNIAK